MPHSIIQPVLALMFLTFLIWLYMYFLRLSYVIKNKIDAQALETPEQCNSILPTHINKPSNNFKNLFEAPVIFYTLCISASFLNQVDNVLIVLAWCFVVGRILHSIFHCFSNSVTLRFYAYFSSSIIMWIMLLKVIYNVLIVT